LAKTQNQNWNYKSKGQSLGKNGLSGTNGFGAQGGNTNNFNNSSNGINAGNLGITGIKFDQSGKGFNEDQTNKNNSFKNKAYINNCKTG
jgi:hypothetical protein